MNEEEQLLLQFLFFIGLYAIVDNNIQHLYRKSFPEFLALILVAWKNNKSDEAINYLKELLEESETTYLYETLTSLLIVNNKLDDALTIIDKGLNYNDTSNVLKSNFAEANYLLGNYNVAEVKFKELVDSNVSFMEPYYYLGLILLNNNENDAALEILKKATLFNDSLVSLVNCEKIKNLITSI